MDTGCCLESCSFLRSQRLSQTLKWCCILSILLDLWDKIIHTLLQLNLVQKHSSSCCQKVKTVIFGDISFNNPGRTAMARFEAIQVIMVIIFDLQITVFFHDLSELVEILGQDPFNSLLSKDYICALLVQFALYWAMIIGYVTFRP